MSNSNKSAEEVSARLNMKGFRHKILEVQLRLADFFEMFRTDDVDFALVLLDCLVLDVIRINSKLFLKSLSTNGIVIAQRLVVHSSKVSKEGCRQPGCARGYVHKILPDETAEVSHMTKPTLDVSLI